MTAAIQVRSLGKRYRIGEAQSRQLLRDRLANLLHAPARLLQGANGNGKPRREEIWALRDVSFDVQQGEVVGLIGRNGAGKSTLLKILSRVTQPTTGWAEVRGRMGSLLEVGTGFHPELTGRENVFLNGAILGMSKAEVSRKFDEIVAFSEIEQFIDTPVKHYSSGMYVRLAFAVAAHLETEILFIDEVLAVGDAAFQKKCLGKMGDISNRGRTVVFVSHNMVPITALCRRCILLDKGQVLINGGTSEVVAAYHAHSSDVQEDGSDLSGRARTGTGKARFSSLSVTALSSDGNPLVIAHTGCDLAIEATIEAQLTLPESNVAIIIYDSARYRLIDANINQRGEFLALPAGGRACVRFLLKQLLLKPGTYFIGLWIGRDGMENIDCIDPATIFVVAPHADTQVHSVVFPGPYLCRFESSILFDSNGGVFVHARATANRSDKS